MKRFAHIATAAVFIALTATACGGDAPDNGDSGQVEIQQTKQAQEAAPTPEGEAPGDGTWVEVSSSSGDGHHTIKHSDGEIEYSIEFEGEEEIQVDDSVESVYVEGADGSDVTCTIWVDGKYVSYAKATDEPARCWGHDASDGSDEDRSDDEESTDSAA